MLHQLPDFAILTIHHGRDGHGKGVDTFRGVVRPLQIQGSIRRPLTQRKGAGYREIVATIAGPFVVRLKEAFVDFGLDFRLDRLVVRHDCAEKLGFMKGRGVRRRLPSALERLKQ